MIFHLAIPMYGHVETEEFYLQLGCKLVRRGDQFLIFDFFENQLVCHLTLPVKQDVTMYPRHFGVNLTEDQFQKQHYLAIKRKLKFFEPTFQRWTGAPEEHRSFFLQDPSDNLIEFKHYTNQRMSI